MTGIIVSLNVLLQASIAWALTPAATDTVADVTAYGANGSDAAEDTAAVLLALQSGARDIFFPPGNYLVKNCVIAQPDRRLSGRHATLKNPDAEPSDCFRVAGERIIIEDLVFETRGTSGGGSSGFIRIAPTAPATPGRN